MRFFSVTRQTIGNSYTLLAFTAPALEAQTNVDGLTVVLSLDDAAVPSPLPAGVTELAGRADFDTAKQTLIDEITAAAPGPDTELEQLESKLAADEATLTVADKAAAVWTVIRRAHSRGRLRALLE